RWRYEGAGDASVDASGNLRIHLASPGASAGTEVAGVLTERAPVAWQLIGDTRLAVSARYSVLADHTVGITLGSYNKAHPLIIDPTLTYSTYLGGSGTDRGLAVAVDASGSAYVTGDTSSTNFPVVNAFQPTNHGSAD